MFLSGIVSVECFFLSLTFDWDGPLFEGNIYSLGNYIQASLPSKVSVGSRCHIESQKGMIHHHVFLKALLKPIKTPNHYKLGPYQL